MRAPTLVRYRPRTGFLIEVSWHAHNRIGIHNLGSWLKDLERFMVKAGVKRAYVARRGFNIQVTFILPRDPHWG